MDGLTVFLGPLGHLVGLILDDGELSVNLIRRILHLIAQGVGVIFQQCPDLLGALTDGIQIVLDVFGENGPQVQQGVQRIIELGQVLIHVLARVLHGTGEAVVNL